MSAINFFGTYAAQDQAVLIGSICGGVAVFLLIATVLIVVAIKLRKTKKLNSKMTITQVKEYVV